jgi:hypothetical protein
MMKLSGLDWRPFVENPACEFLAGRSEVRDVTTVVFFRRSALDAVGSLNEQLHYAMDLDLRLRMAERYKIEILPQLLSWMRMHESPKPFGTMCKSILRSSLSLLATDLI